MATRTPKRPSRPPNRIEEAFRESEQRYRHLLQGLPAAVYTCDADGRITLFNQAAAALWGREPVLGQDEWCGSWKIYRPDGTPMPLDECPMAIALREGRIVRGVEIVIERPDGSRRNVLPHPVPLCDETGAVIGGLNMLIDITDSRRMEESRRESEQRFRTLASHAPVGIFQTGPNGETVFVNESWCEMAGITPDEARGDGWTSVIHPDDHDRVVAGWNRAVKSGMESDVEFRFLRPDGVVTWLQGNAEPLHSDSGQLVGYIGTVADITKRKQAEQALHEADRRKDEFIALLAHELRNPLAPICTGLELMRLAGDNPSLIEDVRSTMERQTQQMVRLIDDLLDVSRITRGTMEMRKCRVELATIVESAVETSRPIIAEAGHRLSVSLPKQPIVLEADATRLAQVISNLLNNAAKYTRRSGEIRLTAERHDREVVVAVSDTGIGIPAEMLGRVFDMFTQLDGSMERTNGGLGIGLTLVKRIVDMHGGRVEAFSEGAGQGSTFTVRLPVIVGLLDETPTTGASYPAAPGRCRVLVADDNEEAARVLGMLIKALGYEVRIAHDGLQALAAGEEFHPNLVLLDIGMPRLNGYDTARRMREQPWGRSTLIAALTGWGQEEDKRRTRDAGFDYHFVKPVEPAALQRLLAQAAR